MGTTAKTVTEAMVERLSHLNDGAKDLVKVGEFRELSRKLWAIYESPEFHQFLEKKNSFENLLFENDAARFGLEYEILRFRLFVFQHLSYFDALRKGKSIDLLTGVYAPNNDLQQVKLPDLFTHLNRLHDTYIVTFEKIEEEAQHEFLRISNDTSTAEEWKSRGIEEKTLWRERVWLILCYVNEIYHLDRFDEALRWLRTVEEFVFGKLADDYRVSEIDANGRKPFNCFTTKATILTLIANCENMMGSLRTAESNYYKAIEFYTHKANNPKEYEENADKQVAAEFSQRKLNNIKFQFRRTAQIFIYGLLKINAKNSNIDRCKANILITELLLSDQKADETSFHMIEFSKAVIRRIEAGNDRLQLIETQAMVMRLKRELQILDHRPLLADVNFELAIICHLLKEWDQAEQLLQEVEAFYDPQLFRIRANIAILRSHVERGKLQLADSLHLAKEALNFAEQSGNTIAIIDALICLGESCFVVEKGGNPTDGHDAHALFEQASLINEQLRSPKIEAICSLGLCKVFAFRKEERNSRECWTKFQNIKQFCQHKFIFDVLEGQAEAEMHLLNQAFIIDSDEKDLDYETHSEKLRAWLYSKARENSITDDEVAKKLRISRQSAFAWRNKYSPGKKRK